MQDNVDGLIQDAERITADLRETLETLSTELSQLGVTTNAGKFCTELACSLASTKKAVAHHRRPKGRLVALEWVGWDKKAQQQREVIRRTAAFVFLRRDYGDEEQFSLKNGEPIGGTKTRTTRIRGYRAGTDRWRIVESELVALREMPIGENEVSRALREIERDRAA